MRITYRWTTNRHSAVLMSITPPPLPTNSNGFVVNSPLLGFCLFWSSLVNFLLLASPVIGFVNTHTHTTSQQTTAYTLSQKLAFCWSISALYLSLTLCTVLGYIDRGGLLLTETAASVSLFVRRHLFERFEMFVKSVDAIILKRMEVFSLKITEI